MRYDVWMSDNVRFYVIEKMLGKEFIDFIKDNKLYYYLSFIDTILSINKSKSKNNSFKNIKLIFNMYLNNYHDKVGYLEKDVFDNFYNILNNYKNIKLKLYTYNIKSKYIRLMKLTLSFNLSLEDLLDILFFSSKYFSISNNNRKFKLEEEGSIYIDKKKTTTYSMEISDKFYKIEVKIKNSLIPKNNYSEDLFNSKFIIINVYENNKSSNYYNYPDTILIEYSEFNKDCYYISFNNMLYNKPKKEFKINLKRNKNSKKINKEILTIFIDNNKHTTIENLSIDITEYKFFDRIINILYPLQMIKYIIEEDNSKIINEYLKIHSDIKDLLLSFDLVEIL